MRRQIDPHQRSQGKTVAVLAVDPSSKASRGALLGDRVRIGIDPNDDGIFIRSIVARGRLGGLADIVYPAAALLRALGRPPESATLEDLRLFRLHLIDMLRRLLAARSRSMDRRVQSKSAPSGTLVHRQDADADLP